MKRSELRSIINEAVKEAVETIPATDKRFFAKGNTPADLAKKPVPKAGSENTYYLFRFMQDRLMAAVKRISASGHGSIPQRFEEAIIYLLSPEEMRTFKSRPSTNRDIIEISYISMGFDRIIRVKWIIVRETALSEFLKEYRTEPEGMQVVKYWDKIIEFDREVFDIPTPFLRQ